MAHQHIIQLTHQFKYMKILQKFKQFAVKGNVVDLAIGVIVGTEFNKIVTSLVNDVIMPPLGLVISGIKFTDLKWVLKPATTDPVTKAPVNAVTLNYENFIQASFNFLIIAFAVFLIVQVFHTLRNKEKAKEAPPSLSKTEELLTEMRDIMKRQQAA